ncbi:hypothetical protein ACVME8_010090 [Bradyrhizobium diazoefficiens]
MILGAREVHLSRKVRKVLEALSLADDVDSAI